MLFNDFHLIKFKVIKTDSPKILNFRDFEMELPSFAFKRQNLKEKYFQGSLFCNFKKLEH